MHLSNYMTLGLSCLCFLAFNPVAFALGTAAGTQVQNSVEVSFNIGNSQQTLKTVRANDVFTVSEIIRSNVSILNPEGVATASPGQDVPLSFQLTNTGNGEEVFRLASQVDSGSDFSAAIDQVWLESNGEPGWQPSDTPYDALMGVTLTADEGVVVYVLSNIPAELTDQAQGDVMLTATSATQGASALGIGEAVPAENNNGVEAVVAQLNASDQDTGSYVVSGIRLKVEKTILSVRDPYQGDRVMPGAAITYQIAVSAEGTGVAQDLKIHDPAPANMSYQSNSLRRDEQALTDWPDEDGGHFDAENQTVWFTPGTITAPLTQLYTLTYIVD